MIKYIPNVRDKIKLTEELVSKLPDQHKVTVEEARVTWWYNIRPQGGLRLTDWGYQILSGPLNLEHHRYVINNPQSFTKHTLLALDKKIQMPYYVKTSKKAVEHIVFFSSQEAMLANLYGDLSKFLDNY